MPIFSTSSSDSRSPAVSRSLIGMPWMESSPSTTSLVVPGIGVTMAFCSPKRAFSRLDLPTFGSPRMATFTPSLTYLPSSLSLIRDDRSSLIFLDSQSTDDTAKSAVSLYSGKSMLVSIVASSADILSFIGANLWLASPLSDLRARSLANSVGAFIRSLTDSASTSPIFPFK